MRIVQITSDCRDHYKVYRRQEPYFGTAPQGLLDGFTYWPGAEVHVISCTRVRTHVPEKLAENIWFHQPVVGSWGWGRSLFAGCVKAVRNLVCEIDPDIVHGQGTERDCAMAAVLSGRPNVVTIHGNMRALAARPENHSLYYKMVAALEGFCVKRTSGVIAISSYTENLVKGLATHIWRLPNAVDRRFLDIECEPQPVPRILFVGSIVEHKNPLGLIHACTPLLQAGACTLAIAGQGYPKSPYVQQVLRLATELPGIEVLGFVARDELVEQFRRSSLMVLPTFEDNCPMVVIEAMVAGLSVAASRVGGVPDLITHELDGMMFDPNDTDEMRACIENLVHDPEKRARLGTQARMTAQKRFHPKVIAGEHLKIYREVLDW